MNSFAYKSGSLHCENVNLEDIARKVGTPTYVYSKETILNHFHKLDSAFSSLCHLTCYAVKACPNIAILQLLARAGSGFDIVSGGELYRVIQAGGDPQKCTFAGVGKTEKEIRYAMENKIYSFNVESLAEADVINKIAGTMGLKAPIALRVNPNVDAKTHKYITTGTNENKFGIDIDLVEDAYAYVAQHCPHIQIKGIQIHIGSQLTQLEPFVKAVQKVAPLAEKLKALYNIEDFSIGGGIGIVYKESLQSGNERWWQDEAHKDIYTLTIEDYAKELLPILSPLGLNIILEPGRVIVGNAGALITECLYVKKGTKKTFKIVDAGFNDLIRPALYEGHHQIVTLKEPAQNETTTIDLVGPICETGDFFASNREISDFSAGDFVALLSAGAYGFSMSSNYNSRPMAAEVLVDGNEYHIIRSRQTWEDLIAHESLLP